MNVRITTKGMKGWFRAINGLKKGVQDEVKTMPYHSSRSFRAIVKRNILALGHYSSPKHNSPVHLIQFLTPPERQKTGQYTVFMRPYIVPNKWIGGEHDITKVVEYGARPHYIFKKVRGELVGYEHPGFIGRRYWEKSVLEYIPKFDGEVGRSVERIMARARG